MAGIAITDKSDMAEAARVIHSMGPQYVLIKGGHLDSTEAIDLLFDGSDFRTYSSQRIETKNTHGTGCTYSAAITAHLARGCPVAEAVELAKNYVTKAIRMALPLGSGHGPLNHFWTFH